MDILNVFNDARWLINVHVSKQNHYQTKYSVETIIKIAMFVQFSTIGICFWQQNRFHVSEYEMNR